MSRHIEGSTREGALRGVEEDGLAIFRGVPYAAAPLGELRFRPPAQAPLRSETLDAATSSAIAPQLPSRLGAVMGDFNARTGEDCLTVDIWAPLPLDRARPILIWFHGGGYFTGAGSLPWYDGARLARDNDVVVINVNYRLGAFGYLFKPGLSDGNMGLLDQVQSIRWVEANAASFGGDPSQITLMGQSAGAHSIACLLAHPDMRSLARRVIMLSTPFGMGALSAEEAISTTDLFCAALGVDPTVSDAIDQLRKVPAERILDAQFKTLIDPRRKLGDPTPPFGPTAVGGLPGGATWNDAGCLGAAGIDIIIGTTADEMTSFYMADPRFSGLSSHAISQTAKVLFGTQAEALMSHASAARPAAHPLELLSDAQTVHYFRQGSERLACEVAASGGRAWVFRFDWTNTDSRFGACHCVELPFVFGTLDAFEGAPMFGTADAGKEALSATVRSAIGQFVIGGDPNGLGLPKWPPFTPGDPAVLIFDDVIRCGLATTEIV